ncbi:hypothetical protein BOX15_Mlig012196g1, partial [Macrostomum lignano]
SPTMFDLLPLLIAYLAICTALLTLYFLSDTKLLRNSPLKTYLIRSYKSTVRLCPIAIRRTIAELVTVLLYRRNTAFQCLLVGLLGLGYFIMLRDAIPILYHWDYHSNHVFLPLLLLFTCLCFYACTCLSDPGEITERTLYKYQPVYGHDGQLFRDDSCCRTCGFVRPARSRHCDTCDVCIHRYDHHCVWTNCCIGGLNLRYFLGFLVSLCCVCLNASWLAIESLGHVVSAHRMWEAVWLDAENRQQPMNLRVLVQHLFVTYPRLVLLAFGPVLVALPLIGYTCYHLYLAGTNQTGYERRKLANLLAERQRYCRLGGDINAGAISATGFGRGWRQNWREVLLPHDRLGRDRVYGSSSSAAASARRTSFSSSKRRNNIATDYAPAGSTNSSGGMRDL